MLVKENTYFVVDLEYPRAELAELVYGIDDWDGYTPPAWDVAKYGAHMFDAVTHRYKDHMDSIGAINRVKSMVQLPLTYRDIQLLNFPPRHGPLLHRDVERLTGILFPIWTTEDYIPIDFWDDNKEHAFSVDYRNQVLVFDAKILHSITNKDDTRYSLQFDIQLPFSEVRDMHSRGELFNV